MGVIRIWVVDVSVRWMKAPTGASQKREGREQGHEEKR